MFQLQTTQQLDNTDRLSKRFSATDSIPELRIFNCAGSCVCCCTSVRVEVRAQTHMASSAVLNGTLLHLHSSHKKHQHDDFSDGLERIFVGVMCFQFCVRGKFRRS